MSQENYLFTKDHEWLSVEGNVATCGVSDYAQHELGDIVYVDLPPVGKAIKKGEALCSIESVKAVSDVFAPVSGKVVAVNEALKDSPDLINRSCEQDGWIFKLEITNADELKELMNYQQYKEYLKGFSE